MDNLPCLDFEAMKNIDLQTVDPDSLVDICDVKVDTALDKKERLLDYIRQIKNPYCYKYGRLIVKVSFADTEATFNDRLENFLLKL